MIRVLVFLFFLATVCLGALTGLACALRLLDIGSLVGLSIAWCALLRAWWGIGDRFARYFEFPEHRQ